MDIAPGVLDWIGSTFMARRPLVCPRRGGAADFSSRVRSTRGWAALEPLEERVLLNAYTVTTLAASGSGSLRWAVEQANSHAGADVIDFGVTGTIGLGGEELRITDAVEIRGPGAGQLTIDAEGQSRAVMIDDGISPVPVINRVFDVSLSGLTLSGGRCDGFVFDPFNPPPGGFDEYLLFSGMGAAVFTTQSLALTNCVVSDNSAANNGGGVMAFLEAALTLTDSDFVRNSVDGDGYAGAVQGSAITAVGCTFSNNAAYEGAAIWSDSGDVTLTDCSFEGNTASDDGPIVWLLNEGQTCAMTNVMMTGNVGQSGVAADEVQCMGVVISDNDLSRWAVESWSSVPIGVLDSAIASNTGGGIEAGGDVNIVGSTISGNGLTGVDALNSGPGGDVVLRDSTIADNGEDGVICAGSLLAEFSTVEGNSGEGLRGDQVAVTLSTVAGNGTGIHGEGDVTVSDCALIGGNTDYGIRGGTVIISNVNVLGNGTGIASEGALSVVNTVIAGNVVEGAFGLSVSMRQCEVFGNGIGIQSVGTLELTDCDVQGNFTQGVYGSDMSIAECLIEGNGTVGIGGEGIVATGRVAVRDTQVLNNADIGIKADELIVQDIEARGNGGFGLWAGTTGEILYSQIENNGGGIGGSASLSVEECAIRNNEGTGLTGKGDVEIIGVEISGNGKGVVSSTGTVVIRSCALLRNSVIAVDVENLTAESCDISDNGQGVLATSEVVLTDCRIERNVPHSQDDGSESEGGGVRGGHVTLRDCEVMDNETLAGGGGVNGSTVLVYDSHIAGNTAAYSAGGIAGSTIVLENVTVTDNTAQGSGGGVSGSAMSLIRSTITGNSAGGDGGGVRGADVALIGTVVSSNSAGGDGGGVKASSRVSVAGSSISGNVSEGNGGGVRADVTVLDGGGSGITGNSAEGYGGGVYGDRIEGGDEAITGNNAEGVIDEPDEYHNEDIYVHQIADFGQTDGALSAVITPARVEVVSGDEEAKVTFDMSSSLGAVRYAIELNGDGEIDEESNTGVFEYGWSDLEDLGLGLGKHDVTGYAYDSVDGFAFDTASAVLDIVLADQEDAHFEVLARGVVYEEYAKRESINLGGYVVDEVFGEGWLRKGLHAYGLVSEVAGADPILVFRGTNLGALCTDPLDLVFDGFDDLDEEGIGYGQFQLYRLKVREWINKVSVDGAKVDLVGHSLGGALAQWFAADYTALSDNKSIGEVVTFNSPGISKEYARKFKPGEAESVRHYITAGDVVSLAGEEFIQGVYTVANWPETDSFDPTKRHTVAVIVDEIKTPKSGGVIAAKSKPAGLVLEPSKGSARLSSPWFFYDSREYLLYLAKTGDYPDLKPLSSLLFCRKTVESARKTLGKNISDRISFRVRELDPSFNSIIIPKIPIPGPWELEDVNVLWDLAGARLEASATLVVGKNDTENDGEVSKNALKIYGEFRIRNGQFDALEFKLKERNTRWGKTSYFLQSLSGSLENFSDVAEGPAEFTLEVSATFGRDISSWKLPEWMKETLKIEPKGALLRLTGKITVDNVPKVTLAGSVELLEGLMGGGDVELVYNFDRFDFDGKIVLDDLFGMYSGTGTLRSGSVSSTQVVYGIEIDARGTLHVPTGLPGVPPWLRGTPLGDATLSLHYHEDGNPSTDFFYLAARAFKDRVWIWLCRDGSSDWGFGWREQQSRSIVPSIPAFAPLPHAVDASPAPLEAEDDLSTWVTLESEAATEATVFILELHDGRIVREDDLDSVPEIERIDSLCTATTRVLSTSFTADNIEQWGIQAENFPVGQSVTLTTWLSDPEPVVTIDAVTGGGEQPVEIEYSLEDSDPSTSVEWYYATAPNSTAGTMMAGANQGDSHFVWDCFAVPAGEYYVYALAKDGINAPVAEHWAQPVQITNVPILSIEDSQGLPNDHAVYFPTTGVGHNAATQRFSLGNAGRGPLHIQSIALDRVEALLNNGYAFDIELLDGQNNTVHSSAGAVLAPGKTIDLYARFSPTVEGVAQVTVIVDAGQLGQVELSLRGSGRESSYAPRDDDGGAVRNGEILEIEALPLLLNDGDGPLRVASVHPIPETHGTVTLAGGVITYTPAEDYVGPASFSYVAIDVEGTAQAAEVSVQVTASSTLTWDGTDGAEYASPHWDPGPVMPNGCEAMVVNSGVVSVSSDLTTVLPGAASLDIGLEGPDGVLSVSEGGVLAVQGGVTVGEGGSLHVDGRLALTGSARRPVAVSGLLSGSGMISGAVSAVTVAGTLAPGGRGASLALDSNAVLEDGSALWIDMIGRASDRLIASGAVTLDPSVSLEIVMVGGGSEFRAGTYRLIDAAGGLTGSFASVIGLGAYATVNGDGLTYDYAAGTVTLTLDKNLNPGDGNLDGQTDVSDRIIWNNHNFTFNTTFQTGDYNGDGQTDVSDRIIWNTHNFTFATATAPLQGAFAEALSAAAVGAITDEEDAFVMASASAALAPEMTQTITGNPSDDGLATNPLVTLQTPPMQVLIVSTPFSPLNQQTNTARTSDASAPAAAQLEPDIAIDFSGTLDEELDVASAAR